MKRSPINAVSAKRRARQAAYRAARDAVERRSEGRCEARAYFGCVGTGEHAHHVRRRSQGGTDDPSNLLWCCFACHGWIHDHPLLASRAGLLWSRRDEPAESDMVPCICGRMSRVVPCYRCELEDDRGSGDAA
jgi:hypothetical protein